MLDRKLLDIKTTRYIGPKVLFNRLLIYLGGVARLGTRGLASTKHSIGNLLRTNPAYFSVGIMSFYGQGSI